MNRWGVILVTVFLILTGCEAKDLQIPKAPREGVGSSGGGIGVLCGEKLQTLDLYEAQAVQGLTLQPVESSFNGNLVKSVRKFLTYYSTDPLPPSDDTLIDTTQHDILDLIRDVTPGSLKLSEDATLPTIPNGCQFVQIALYDDAANVIYLDRSLWNRLDFQEQAALIMHEAVYKIARENRGRTSDETRRIVGLVFSTASMPAMWEGFVSRDVLVCMAGFGDGRNNEFTYLAMLADETQDGIAGVRAYFSLMEGYLLLSRTTAFFPGQTQASIMSQGFKPVTQSAYQPLMDRTWNLEILPLPFQDNGGQFIEFQIRGTTGDLSSVNLSRGFCQPGRTGSGS